MDAKTTQTLPRQIASMRFGEQASLSFEFMNRCKVEVGSSIFIVRAFCRTMEQLDGCSQLIQYDSPHNSRSLEELNKDFSRAAISHSRRAFFLCCLPTTR